MRGNNIQNNTKTRNTKKWEIKHNIQEHKYKTNNKEQK